MSIIPQFGFLYNASLRENLDPEGLVPRAELQRVVGETRLRLTRREAESNEREAEEPADLEFEVENSGGNLSNGEKQIINFLRVVVRSQQIICLDEATSNMDPKTD